jgi:hypothetical protein
MHIPSARMRDGYTDQKPLISRSIDLRFRTENSQTPTASFEIASTHQRIALVMHRIQDQANHDHNAEGQGQSGRCVPPKGVCVMVLHGGAAGVSTRSCDPLFEKDGAVIGVELHEMLRGLVFADYGFAIFVPSRGPTTSVVVVRGT